MFALAPLLLQAVLMITTASTSESSESGGPHPRLRSTRVHHGVWSARPLWTPSCYNGIFPDTNQDPTRTFCCSVNSEVCSEKYSPPAIPVSSLPSYTKDPRRDHHHVVDGPVVGNGNLGIAIGSGNIFNVSHNWIGRGNLMRNIHAYYVYIEQQRQLLVQHPQPILPLSLPCLFIFVHRRYTPF